VSPADLQLLRSRLCELGDAIRDAVVTARHQNPDTDFAGIADVTAADVIYAIDKVSEDAILDWFRRHWPEHLPVELIMEGLEDAPAPVTFPAKTPREQTVCVCLVDPIDGTRGLMYDKRAAWALAGLAPRTRARPGPTLADITVAAMTEIPTTKQWRADQASAIRGEGTTAHAINVLTGERAPLAFTPSDASDCQHAFAAIARFLPPAKAALGRLEEELWARLHGSSPAPVIFEDQYISTGGQFAEILAGHDRFLADLRPYAYRKLGCNEELVCHPYDVATALVLQEAGCVLEEPIHGTFDVPLDTTSPVAWAAYANPALARSIGPVLGDLIQKHFL
jgi:hypothetical protein